MSVMRDLTIADLMRFVITPKDPTTAIVSLDIREMDGPVQVVLVNEERFRDKVNVVMAGVKLFIFFFSALSSFISCETYRFSMSVDF